MRKIKSVAGLNASAGIPYNKFLAKMASDLNKPNGQTVISPKNGPAFVDGLAVKKFRGVGQRREDAPPRHQNRSQLEIKIAAVPD